MFAACLSPRADVPGSLLALCEGTVFVASLIHLLASLSFPRQEWLGLRSVTPRQLPERTLSTRALRYTGFACMEYSEVSNDEYLAAFFFNRRILLSGAWAKSCLVLCFAPF